MKKFNLLILIAIVFFVSSCRYKDRHWETKVPASNPYKTFVVEIKDGGEYWDEKYASDSLNYITERAKNNNVVVLLFVHGWHHNASGTDSNFKSFQISLAELRKKLDGEKYKRARKILTGNEDVEVVGIYVGWRGRALKNQYLDYLTIWNRKKAAINVGLGDLQSYISKLNDIYLKNYASSNPNFMGLVSVGHSFGGQVLFKTLSKTLEQSFADNSNDGKPIQGFGDIVVLLNPAFESKQFDTLSNLLNEHADFTYSQTPQLLVVSGKGDGANQIFFPPSRFVANPFRIFDFQQLQSLGMYVPHVTHSLKPVKGMPPTISDDVTLIEMLNFNKLDFTERIVFGEVKLERKENFHKSYSPLVIAKTQSEVIIKGHNGIFTDVFHDFLMDYVAYIEAKKILNRFNRNKKL